MENTLLRSARIGVANFRAGLERQVVDNFEKPQCN